MTTTDESHSKALFLDKAFLLALSTSIWLNQSKSIQRLV
ncbi:hypothetical protein AO377_0095 [Moraxella catarrhalis]|nr:hypothetical protein AO377_0095 [Moraxella catarrhalis]OAV14280.1 hypothetical protein AO375_1122 [Moraxella catarrhalis]OAV35532.1 hypothetical protein AO365_1242 [Moraxella catarrhalis]